MPPTSNPPRHTARSPRQEAAPERRGVGNVRRRFPVPDFFDDTRSPDTWTTPTWLLRVAAVALLLAANILLQAAAFQPAAVVADVEARRYSTALDGTVSLAFLVTVLVVVSWRTRRDYWRFLAAGFLVFAGVVGALVLWSTIPDPGPGGGMGLRGPVGAYAFGCCALAGLLLLVSARGRGLFTRWRVVLSAGLAVAGMAAAIAPAEAWLPPVVIQANVATTTASGPPPEPVRPRVDGTLAWGSAALPSTPDGPWVATAGGFAAGTPHGLQMIDPATGAIRWAFRRYDLTDVGTPEVSPDGGRVAITGLPATTSNVLRKAEPALHLWLFDAETGRLLAHRLAPDISSTLRALTGELLLWSKSPGAGGDPSATVDAIAVDSGAVRWHHRLPAYCGLQETVEVDVDGAPALLLLSTCRTGDESGGEESGGPAGGTAGDGTGSAPRPLPARIQLVDAATGATRWSWTAPHAAAVRLVPDVAAGVVTVQLSGSRSPGQILLGLRLTDGAEKWRRTTFADRPAAEGTADGTEGYAHALVSAGPATVAARTDGAAGTVELARVDSASGRLRWSAAVPIDWPSELDNRITGLVDGRVVVADRTGGSGGELVIRVVDSGTGERLAPAGTGLSWSTVRIRVAPGGAVLVGRNDDAPVAVGLE